MFDNDNIRYLKGQKESLGNLSLNYIIKSIKHGFTVPGNENDYVKHLNYMLSYATTKNRRKFDKRLDDA
jgi:hypothetical protein